jgi:AbrB family looped-hinge helix DNA binding protein
VASRTLKVTDILSTILSWLKPIRNGIMRGSSVTLDRAGRLVLPKSVREELRLSPGDTLDLAIQDEAVTLRPRRSATPLQKERGVWVLRTGRPMAATETDEKLRSLRSQRNRQAVEGR